MTIAKRFRSVLKIKMVGGETHKVVLERKLEPGEYPFSSFVSTVMGKSEFLHISMDRKDGGKDILINVERIDTVEVTDVDSLESFNKLGDDE